MRTKKSKSFIVISVLLLLVLTGCAGKKVTGTVKFYSEPTEEFTEPAQTCEVQLSGEQAKVIKDIIYSVKWIDDNLVDRLKYYFDGEIQFSDSSTVYYFTYKYNVIYYDHSFGQISEEDMQYIRQLSQ